MGESRTLTVTLPDDLARLIETKIASGEFLDESAVIAEGLEELRDRGQDIETWLRDEVVPALDALDSDPSRALSSEEVQGSLNEAYARAIAPR